MAIDQESFNSKLYDLLKVRGYKPVPLNSQNQRVNASQNADVIEFTFMKDDEDYGKAWVSIDDAQNVIVYYDSEQEDSPDVQTPGLDYDDTWTGFLKFLKSWAQRRQLSFELSNKDRLGDDMKQRDYYKMKEKLGESIIQEARAPFKKGDIIEVVKGEHAGERGKVISVDKDWELVKVTLDKFPDGRASGNWNMFKKVDGPKKPSAKLSGPEREIIDLLRNGTSPEEVASIFRLPVEAITDYINLTESYHPMGKKASYNDAVPNVKIIVQHNRALEEGEARFRNVAKIFLENEEGERFLAPTTKPGVARVYARHLAEGGVPNDDRWNHIKGLCEEYNNMAGFVRATKNGQFNESVQSLISEGVNHYNKLRESLHKLTGHRGYTAYFESWTPTLMEDEGSADISEMFMSSSMDPRIETVMPILSRLHKNVAEAKEVGELSSWASNLISETLDDTEELEEDESLTSNNPQGIPESEELDEAPSYPWLDHPERPANKQDKQGEEYKKWRKEKFNDKKTTDDIVKGSSTRTKFELDEDEFAGNFKTGPAGQWRNKGPKANKPAKVGDLVGASESKEMDSELARILEMTKFKR